MIPTLQDLVAVLSQDVALADLASRLGPVVSQPGGSSPVELAPSASDFRAVSVASYPHDGKPYTVALELTAPIPIAALAEAFGAYKQARTDRGHPRKLIFAATGAPWHVVLIAEVAAGASRLDEATTSKLILRRDPP